MNAKFECKNCGKVCWGRKDAVDSGRKKFCCRSCSSAYNTTARYSVKPSDEEVLRLNIERFWEKVDKNGPIHPVCGQCWQWSAGLFSNGYGQFWRTVGAIPAHRFSWLIHGKGNIKRGLHICHHCDNRLCVNPDHLFIGTCQDNKDDCVAKERQARGEGVNTAKLTEEDVIEIRRLGKLGLPHAEIGKNYPQISTRGIGSVLRGSTWKHVQGGPVNPTLQ